MIDNQETDKSAVELEESSLEEASGGVDASFKFQPTGPADLKSWKLSSAPISDGTSNLVIKH